MTDEEYKPLELFDYIKAMTSKKCILNFGDPVVSKNYKQFMINKTIASCEIYTGRINTVFNRKASMNIPDELHFEFLRQSMPGKYIPMKPVFAKKNKNDWLKPYISDFFEIGYNDVDSMIDDLTESDLALIMDEYQIGKNGQELAEM